MMPFALNSLTTSPESVTVTSITPTMGVCDDDDDDDDDGNEVEASSDGGSKSGLLGSGKS